jgi:hypothetical protein
MLGAHGQCTRNKRPRPCFRELILTQRNRCEKNVSLPYIGAPPSSRQERQSDTNERFAFWPWYPHLCSKRTLGWLQKSFGSSISWCYNSLRMKPDLPCCHPKGKQKVHCLVVSPVLRCGHTMATALAGVTAVGETLAPWMEHAWVPLDSVTLGLHFWISL